MKLDRESVDHAAAQWVARLEQGLTPAQQAEFDSWLRRDERHEAAFRDLRSAWSELDELRGTDAAVQLGAELERYAPDSGAAVERFDAAAVPHASRFGWGRWVSGALAASVLWGALAAVWWRQQHESAPHAETAATEVGAVREMRLPDGSTARLNTDSAIEVFFTRSERRVRLARGEAFFSVASNPARPFVVSVAGVDVRAVGTEFNVRLRAAAVEVTVREGKVRVDDAANGASLLAVSARPAAAEPGAAEPVLVAGQRLVIPVSPAPAPAAARVAPIDLPPVEVERALAWREQRLVFDSAPLGEIVAELNRFSRTRLVIADPKLAASEFGGSFRADDPKTFLDLLRMSYDVVADERAHETVLRLRETPPRK